MKKIALLTLAFLLSLSILDRTFSYVFMKSVFQKTLSGESGGTINYAISEKQTTDFLIMGASRAKHSIDPSLVPALGKNGYNMGINGTNALNTLLILDILLANNVTTKTLIIQTDLRDHLEAKKDTSSALINQIKRVYPYDTPLIRSYVKDAGITEQIKYFFDLYKLNGKIINISYNFLKRNRIGNTNGYVPLPQTTYHQNPQNGDDYVFHNTGTNAQALRDIKELSEKHGIKLIVILMPSYENIIYNKEQTARMIEAFKADGILNIVDLSDIYTHPELNDTTLWRDGVHLNYKGAEIFSKIFNQKIIEMRLN